MVKLKRYNQILLAIIGTLIVVAAVVMLIIGLGGLLISTFTATRDNDALTAQTATVTEDSSQIMRTQEITFVEPIQLDTAQAKFIVPVGHVNLEETKRVPLEKDKTRSLLNVESSYYYESYYGQYNNFIYYDHKKNFKKVLFDQRIAITHWAFLQHQDMEALLFKGAIKDDNADNQLDRDDYQKLFVYFIADDNMISYDLVNYTVLNFEPLKKTDLVYVTMGVDQDKNKKYEGSIEPQHVMVLNLNSRSLNDMIPEEMQNDIQRLVDGV